MKINVSNAIFLLSICLLSACGNTKSGGNVSHHMINQNESIRADGSNIRGIYQADLLPVNHNLHFKKVGVAAIKREDDSFSASVHLKYGPREVYHKQSIYTGRRCPNLNDDKNKDAYIDINEAQAVIGQMTIPLDGDLNSQFDGFYDFPMGDGVTGTYFYQQSASFEQLFAELREADADETDNLVKLKEGEGLTFPGRVVVIHGLSRKVILPDSVATTDDEDVYDSIPVACGVLWKVDILAEELQ